MVPSVVLCKIKGFRIYLNTAKVLCGNKTIEMAFFSTTIKSTSSQQLCQLYFIFTAVISAVSFSRFLLVHELGPGSLFMQNMTGPRTRHGLTSCSAYACCLVSSVFFLSRKALQTALSSFQTPPKPKLTSWLLISAFRKSAGYSRTSSLRM